MEQSYQILSSSSMSDKDRFEKLMADVRQTLEKSAKTMASVSNTIKICQEAKDSAAEAIGKIDEFKQNMSHALNSLVGNIAISITGQRFKRFSQQNHSKAITAVGSNTTLQEVASLLKKHKRIAFLTGAGLSVASGLPTFRGTGGIWTTPNSKQTFNPQDICTSIFFRDQSELYWTWHEEFVARVRKCQPNNSHHQIARFYSYLNAQADSKLVLVTQNIDGYHVDAYKKQISQQNKSKQIAKPETYGFCESVYELHGNIRYLRCQKDCKPMLSDYSKKDAYVCGKCGTPTRPHVLFFDEMYTEEHYRRDSVLEDLKDCEILIVVGTMLETNLASHIVEKFIQRELPIIEINPQPVIDYEKNSILAEKSEDVIPQLIDLVIGKQ